MEFGVEIGECRGVVRVPRGVFQRLLAERALPPAVHRSLVPPGTRFESIAERRLRRPQLTEDLEV